MKKNLDKKSLNSIAIKQQKNIKYNLRALPNEISNGISTSVIFSAWNAAVYVNQINDLEIHKAEKNNSYEAIVKKIIKKYDGLWFNDELLIITKK